MWLLPARHAALAAAARGRLDRPGRSSGSARRARWRSSSGTAPSCDHLVHEVELQVRDIVDDLPPVFEAFYDDEEARTCASCGPLHPGKG